MEYTTLNKLGVPTFHPETLDWRHPYKDEIKSDILIGKKFRIGRHYKRMKDYLHTCKSSDWISNKKPSLIKYKYGEIESSATFFMLPCSKQLTDKEKLDWIKTNLDIKSFDLPKIGCQLHGDIDLTLEMKNGITYKIPWNY